MNNGNFRRNLNLVLVEPGNGCMGLRDLGPSKHGGEMSGEPRPKPDTYFLIVLIKPGRDKAHQDAQEIGAQIQDIPGVAQVNIHKASPVAVGGK